MQNKYSKLQEQRCQMHPLSSKMEEGGKCIKKSKCALIKFCSVLSMTETVEVVLNS